MGTRSVIAAEVDNPDGEGTIIKGVYAHWDGYPDHMLVELQKIVARDGVEKAVEELLRQGGQGWSSIDSDNVSDVPGYGRRFTDAPDWAFRTDAAGDGEEYFYVIRKDGQVVWTTGAADRGPWYNEVREDGDDGYGPGAESWRDLAPLKILDEDDLIRIEHALADQLVGLGVPVSQWQQVAEKVARRLAAGAKEAAVG